MWWRVQREFFMLDVAIRDNFIVEQNQGEWIFWRTFKTKGKAPKKRITVRGEDRTIRNALVEGWLVPMEEPAWSKALYRPTAWEHLDADPFGAL